LKEPNEGTGNISTNILQRGILPVSAQRMSERSKPIKSVELWTCNSTTGESRCHKQIHNKSN